MPQEFIYLAIALLVSLTFHEASHALSAYSLGDSTAKSLGRLSLNPIRHLDPLGTIFLIVMAFSGFGIGWAKPVPVNPYNLRIGPKTGMAIVALAGPLSNMVLAGIMFLLAPSELRQLWMTWPFFSTISAPVDVLLIHSLFWVNVSLAAFNLIPIPPLDGFSVLLGILPESPAYSLRRLAPYGPALLLFLLMVPGVLRTILSPLTGIVSTLVTLGAVPF